MRTFAYHILLIGMAAVFGGCAVGQKYNYNTNAYALPIQPQQTTEAQLLVVDERPYVVSGDKDADFVGLQRGGFGNPFDVTTASGKPLAEDVALSLERSLEARGYVIEVISDLSQATARRVIVLRMVEWKTDIYAQITLHFDLVIQVRNEAGEVVAEKEVKGEEPIGGGKISPSQNAKTASDALAVRIGSLFLDGDVAAALE